MAEFSTLKLQMCTNGLLLGTNNVFQVFYKDSLFHHDQSKIV
jgi:hypothetical protein